MVSVLQPLLGTGCEGCPSRVGLVRMRRRKPHLGPEKVPRSGLCSSLPLAHFLRRPLPEAGILCGSAPVSAYPCSLWYQLERASRAVLGSSGAGSCRPLASRRGEPTQEQGLLVPHPALSLPFSAPLSCGLRELVFGVQWVPAAPLGTCGWGRRGAAVFCGAAGSVGVTALSGLKLRGKDVGKPIEKGPRAK